MIIVKDEPYCVRMPTHSLVLHQLAVHHHNEVSILENDQERIHLSILSHTVDWNIIQGPVWLVCSYVYLVVVDAHFEAYVSAVNRPGIAGAFMA